MTQPKLRFLGVVAHPHDFTHFAGTLGIHTALGDSATVVAMMAIGFTVAAQAPANVAGDWALSVDTEQGTADAATDPGTCFAVRFVLFKETIKGKRVLDVGGL